MGKPLWQQRKGKGSPSFKSPSHRFAADAKHAPLTENTMTGTVKDIIHSAGHTAPLAEIRLENGGEVITIAPEGIKVGTTLATGNDAPLEIGNTLPLKNIPDGTMVYNIELNPGDGGRFARSSGAAAKLLSKTAYAAIVQLPSKKNKEFNLECRATIGNVAGSGRTEKPLLKAGAAFHKHHTRNRRWPIVSGLAMNAVDHPYGGKRGSRKGKPTIAPKNAPPGRKVGKFRPKETGRAR